MARERAISSGFTGRMPGVPFEPYSGDSEPEGGELLDWVTNNTGFSAVIAGAADNVDDSRFLDGVLSFVPALISAIDEKDKVIFASEHHLLMDGVPLILSELRRAEDLFPTNLLQRIHTMYVADEHHDVQPSELTVRHRDGSMHIYKLTRRKIQKADGGKVIVTVGMDVTARKQAENSLKDHKSRLDYMVFHDSLTGLPNRSLFYDRVNKSVSRAVRNKCQFAIMLVDLDRFKNVNDSLGHDAGDALLKMVADILSEELRDTDTVARLGGDEFVIVLESIHTTEDVEKIASKILDRLAVPVSLHGHEIASTASAGISMFPNDGETIDQLLKHADVAKYKAKTAGKNRFELFKKKMSETAVNYLLLENDLRRAIEQNEILLHYQPQINLHTGRIIGLEALVRWNSKERGMVAPFNFIPLAEETGLIEPLGEWVLRHACERFHSWLMNGYNLGKVAVNLSVKQFRKRRFEQTVMSILMDTRLSPQYLELEITETSAMENAEEAISMLNCLHKLGLSIAIDDFGTGYSSLAYLQRFPIQKLKIDRSFVNDIDSGQSDATIAKSIIDLAHNMSLQVIAEGVERPGQSEWLINRGCDQVQGFYYSRPLSEEQLIALINSDKVRKDESGISLIL